MIYIPRFKKEQEIKSFLLDKKPRSSFTYVRGRRRIGKSTLLEKITNEHPLNFFYFTGVDDESSKNSMIRFVEHWYRFMPSSQLKKIKTSELTWDYIFEEINKEIITSNKIIGLIFDEIQWLAKSGSGFVGLLKSAWLKFEKNKKTRIIVCGSSNKFFSVHVGGEEKILRGLKTRADIWIPPLSINEVKKYYGKNYSSEETFFAYMLLGGVPYYWNQIDSSLSFLQALNKALFLKSSIFLEEVDEILKLEFNNKGLPTIKRILSQISYPGVTAAHIIKESLLPESTVIEALEKLCEYNILRADYPVFKKSKANRSGSLYYLKDPYLNFYFSVYRKWEAKIRVNLNQFLISQVLDSKKSLYINSFTGQAFELVIRNHLEEHEYEDQPLLDILELKNISWKVGRHWDKEHEIDLVIYEAEDRIYRLIECKWIQTKGLIKEGLDHLKTLKGRYPSAKLFVLSNKTNRDKSFWIDVDKL